MNKIQAVPCKCGKGSHLVMLNMGNEDTNQLTAVWCPCGKMKRNAVLEILRKEYGWDLSPALFNQKVKPQYRADLILGKFKTQEALLKSYHHLARKLGLSQQEADSQATRVGLEKAYRRLEAALSRLAK